MMMDELHLFLRLMLRNLIKMSHGHIQQLVACIRSCGVTFNIWESESSDGMDTINWGSNKKKVLKVKYALYNSCVPILPISILCTIATSFQDEGYSLPNAVLHDVVKLWKVQYFGIES